MGKKDLNQTPEIKKPTSTNDHPVFNFDKIPAGKPENNHIDVDHTTDVDKVVNKLELTPEHFQAFGINQITTLKYLEPFNKTIEKYNINTPLRLAHFMAQCLHESGNLRYTREIADGSAYEGRKDLGNTQPGDGKKFSGSGFLQATGRHTFEQYGKYLGVDLTSGDNAKRVANEPELTCDVSGWFWDVFKKDKSGDSLNNMSDKDLFLRITYFVNGGFNGINDRVKKLKKSYTLFGVDGVEDRMNAIFNYIENNLKIENRTTGLHNALFKAVPDLKTLEQLKKI